MSADVVIRTILLAAIVALAGCASSKQQPDLPYPAFVATGDIAVQFLAALPGVRARVYNSDMRTRSISARVDIPIDWTGTTGGDPGKSIEIFVLAGELRFSDFALGPGGYAYVPPGSLGFALASDVGAQVLYFLDEVDPASVIRTPIILESALLDWHADGEHRYTRSLRDDPGSGARSWLLRIEPGVELPWESSTATREGYLVTGQYQHGECVNGIVSSQEYPAGGYFRRPANTINGGPQSQALSATIWFLRELNHSQQRIEDACF